MRAVEVQDLLERLDACMPARVWAQGKTSAEVWSTCERPDWMLWLAGRLYDGDPVKRAVVILAAAECGELSLPFFERRFSDDRRPRVAVETAFKVARGEASALNAESAVMAAQAAYDAAGRCAGVLDASFAAHAALSVARAAFVNVAVHSYAAIAVENVCAAAASDGFCAHSGVYCEAALAFAVAARATMTRRCVAILRRHIPTCPGDSS